MNQLLADFSGKIGQQCTEAFQAHRFLHDFRIAAVFQHMDAESPSQRVGGYLFVNIGGLAGLTNDAIHGAGRNGSIRIGRREEPPLLFLISIYLISSVFLEGRPGLVREDDAAAFFSATARYLDASHSQILRAQAGRLFGG